MALSEAQAIDDAVDALRRALRDPLRSGVERLARSLDEKLMRSVRALLGPARHLLISPDGSLNLIPFAALVDEQNRFLIERYAITYLTSGRDLLRLQARQASRSRAVIVADPEFGDPPIVYVDEKTGQRKPGGRAQFDTSRVIFAPLAGAKGELRALRELLPQAAVLTREQATEAALRQFAGPQLLHIATHGFFLTPELLQNARRARQI
ncbi:MAG TPA: CHAT domain-containing protein [Blastocatellia bacterium]|nr:CHAT domain-containing protein [Blastocatellia bacterium]